MSKQQTLHRLHNEIHGLISSITYLEQTIEKKSTKLIRILKAERELTFEFYHSSCINPMDKEV